MNKYIFMIFTFLLGLPVIAQTLSLQDVVGKENAQRLMNDGYLYNEDSRPVVKFIENGILKDQMQLYIKELDANFSLEFLYFVPKNQWTEFSPIQIIEKLLDIESLSRASILRNDQSTDPLFKGVIAFSDETNRKAKPVYPSVSLPFEFTQYINVKDAKFGKIDYRVDYHATEQVVILSLMNYSSLSYMLRKIADRQKMRLTFMQQELKEGRLYVGHISAYIHDVDKAKKAIHLPSFFSRRVEGLKGWYFQQIYDIKVAQGIYPVAIQQVP